MFRIFQAETVEHIAAAREMMREYQAELGISLCFQNFDQELHELPGQYAPPSGRLLLAEGDNHAAGVIALRPIHHDLCEMKRLYVRSAFRGHALGRRLVDELIVQSRLIGYRRMRLDTMLGRMDHAIGLYRTIGFREIEPYYSSPIKETLFLELKLE